jgi:hypothetical protein
VNKRTSGNHGAEFDGTNLIGNTKYLMNDVNSLAEVILLTGPKRSMDSQ